MKLQIDTELKTVKIEGQVNLKEFTERIKTILPDWEDYKLETNTVIQNWNNPFVVPYVPFAPYTRPYYPWTYLSGQLTGGPSLTVTNCVNSVHNIELN